MLAAAIAISFRLMCRVSEVAQCDKTKHTLQCKNVLLAKGQVAGIVFNTSKTFSKPYPVPLECLCSWKICAKHLLQKWLELRSKRGITTKQLFVRKEGQPLNRADFNNIVKDMARKAALPDTDYATHSLRKGGSSHYAAIGTPITVIEAIGRWCPASKVLRDVYIQISTEHAAKFAANTGTLSITNKQTKQPTLGATTNDRVTSKALIPNQWCIS